MTIITESSIICEGTSGLSGCHIGIQAGRKTLTGPEQRDYARGKGWHWTPAFNTPSEVGLKDICPLCFEHGVKPEQPQLDLPYKVRL